MREQAGRWQRSPVGTPVCLCGHTENSHRPDLQRLGRCTHNPCGCTGWRPGWVEHREWRVVRVYPPS